MVSTDKGVSFDGGFQAPDEVQIREGSIQYQGYRDFYFSGDPSADTIWWLLAPFLSAVR